MSTHSNTSIPNNNGNPPQDSGKGKARETTPDREAREQEEREERERERVAWEQAVEDAKTPEERAAEEAKRRQQQDADERLAESLQEEERKAAEKAEADRKEAERKETKQKAKAEEKWKRQEKMAKDAMDEISAQLRAVEMKEIAVASRRQTLAERDEHVRDIFARAGNQELTAEDLEELENILRGESPDNSDVSDKTNDEADSEPDPNEVQTGKKRKRVSGRKSSAGKALAKKPRKAETSRKGGEVGRARRAMRPEEIVWGPAPEPCGRCAANNRKCQILTNDPNKAACRQCGAGKNRCDLVPGDGRPVNKPRKTAGATQRPKTKKRMGGRDPSEPPVAGLSRTRLGKCVEALEEEMKTVRQSLVMERRFNGWLAAEIVRREPANKWRRVYLQSINWSPQGEEYPADMEQIDDKDEVAKDGKVPEDRKELEDSSSESSKDSQVESWRKDVVPVAPEGERPVEEQPDDQMQVDDTPVDGETGDGEMQVDPPASRSSSADQPPIVERPEGIKIEVRSPEQMLTDLGRQLARNWLHEQKVAKREKEEAEDVEKRRKIAEQREELEKEEAKLRRRDERRKKAAEREPSVKKETEEGEVPPPAPPRPVVHVREVNNVVEILDSEDEKAPEGLEESEDM
ncbi:hypothetical protein C8R45DRAFT_1115224 [Mycena sanguinolenta]|nr:hypothetical protein C8R45DRAFT_1115224 [Mycena sanguinolenta]